jgi:hypothetical protein
VNLESKKSAIIKIKRDYTKGIIDDNIAQGTELNCMLVF